MCASLPHNRWQQSYIARGETYDDVDKIEKCIKRLLGPQSLDMVRFLTSTQKSEAVNRSYHHMSHHEQYNSVASGYGEDLHT
jgi:hypothetical protein